MIENLTYSVLIIAIGIACLAIKVIIRKNGTMSSMHSHDSQAMKDSRQMDSIDMIVNLIKEVSK